MEINGRIFKSFVPGKKDQSVMGGGVMNSLSWETLKPFLESACKLRPNEILVGVIADDQGITFKFETKR